MLILMSSVALGGYAHAQLLEEPLLEEPKIRCERRIYIWDVTKSMQGHNSKTQQYDPTIDVWDSLVEWLKNDINSQSDSSTDIVVLPFQEEILDCWETKATAEGKRELLRKIDEAKKRYQNLTYTNISGPFEVVKRDYVNAEKNNVLILLTDGKQSDKFGSQEKWNAVLQKWGEFAKKNNAYLVYFMVTEHAVDPKTEEIITTDSNKRYIFPIRPTDILPVLIDICPQSPSDLNIKDGQGKEIIIPLHRSKKGIELAEGIKIQVEAVTDAPIEIKGVVEVKDNQLAIKPIYDFEELKKYMGVNENMNVTLTFKLLNEDEIQQNTLQKIFLRSDRSNLELINKIEKVLTIQLKK